MSLRPRKPKPEGIKPRRKPKPRPAPKRLDQDAKQDAKQDDRVSLRELNEFAESLAEKARANMMSQDQDNGPYLTPTGRIGGPFSMGGWTSPGAKLAPGDRIPGPEPWLTYVRDEKPWEELKPEDRQRIDDLIKAGQETTKPAPPIAPTKPNRGRMVKLKEEVEKDEKD